MKFFAPMAYVNKNITIFTEDHFHMSIFWKNNQS